MMKKDRKEIKEKKKMTKNRKKNLRKKGEANLARFQLLAHPTHLFQAKYRLQA